jgi:tetratricopeptide (TPR) repeat protein
MLEVAMTPTAAAADAARRSQELFERFGDRWRAAFSKLLRAWVGLQRLGPNADAIRLVEEAEATFDELDDPWGMAFAGQSRFAMEAYLHGLTERGEEAGRRALERFQDLDDQWGLAQAQVARAELAAARGDVDGAAAAYEAAMAAAGEMGPRWVQFASMVRLGTMVALQGDDARAAVLRAEAADRIRRFGERRGFAHLYNEMGGVARARDDLERARHLHREALPIVQELVGWSVPYTLASLACAEARLGDLDDAEAHLREAAGLLFAAPQAATVALVLTGAALAAIGRGRPELAARRLAAAEAVRERAGVAPIGGEAREAELAAEAVRAALDPAAQAAARDAGRALATEDALRELVAGA